MKKIPSQNINFLIRIINNLGEVEETKKIIKCPYCKGLVYSANWHYKKCDICGEYIWDDR